jgi:hypothetical protein
MVNLQGLRQRNRSANVGLLRGLVAAGKHHNQRLAALDVVHAPVRPKVLAHLEHTFAYRLHVAEVAQLGLAQPLVEALPGQSVFQALEPVGAMEQRTVLKLMNYDARRIMPPCNLSASLLTTSSTQSLLRYGTFVLRQFALFMSDLACLPGTCIQPRQRSSIVYAKKASLPAGAREAPSSMPQPLNTARSRRPGRAFS